MIRIGFTLLMIARLTQGWIWNYNGTWTEAFQSAMESSSSFLDNLATKIHQHPTVEAVCEQRFCQNGSLPIANETLIPEPNGCGSYGLLFPREYMQSITACCDTHDLCYAECGVRRSHCDQKFNWCLRSLCHKVKNLVGGEGETFKACKSAVKNAVGLVKSLGCPTFIVAQASYCYCPESKNEL